jgi:hypothetical protein
VVAAGYDDVPPGCHSDGTPIMWRRVGKNEFGEVVRPLPFLREKRLPDRYAMELQSGTAPLEAVDHWQPLPGPNDAEPMAGEE